MIPGGLVDLLAEVFDGSGSQRDAIVEGHIHSLAERRQVSLRHSWGEK
jgi:hypothetical protein